MNIGLYSIYYNLLALLARNASMHVAADVIKFDSVPLTRRSWQVSRRLNILDDTDVLNIF